MRAIDTTSAQITAAAKGEGEKFSAEFSGNVSIAPSFDFGKQGFDETILGEEMTDPDTGESLGSEEEKLGTAKVVKVTPKYSIAETKAVGVRKTDILKEEK